MKKNTAEITNETFAFAVKAHRDRLNLTQTDAAKLLNVSSRIVQRWEKTGRATHPTKVGVLHILGGL